MQLKFWPRMIILPILAEKLQEDLNHFLQEEDVDTTYLMVQTVHLIPLFPFMLWLNCCYFSQNSCLSEKYRCCLDAKFVAVFGFVMMWDIKSKAIGIIIQYSSALLAQLGGPDNFKCCSAPCCGFVSRSWPMWKKYFRWSTKNRVMGYKICQLILSITTYWIGDWQSLRTNSWGKWRTQ